MYSNQHIQILFNFTIHNFEASFRNILFSFCLDAKRDVLSAAEAKQKIKKTQDSSLKIIMYICTTNIFKSWQNTLSS